MSLQSGTRLGPYEVVAAIGVGGMGACGHAARERGVGVSGRGGGFPTRCQPTVAAGLAGMDGT